jgi:ATP-dependent protease ClpP protease subunit
LTRQLQVIEARFEQEKQKIETVANTRGGAVAEQLALLQQVRRHQENVLSSCVSVVTSNAESYREILSSYLDKRGRGVSGPNGAEISVHDYKNMTLDIPGALAEALNT